MNNNSQTMRLRAIGVLFFLCLFAIHAPANPDIGAAIADHRGDNCDIEVSPGFFQYHNSQIGEVHTMQVTIGNSGGADCMVSSIVMQGDSAFSLADPAGGAPFLVSNGESVQVAVEFAPTILGFVEAEMLIETNDPNQSVFFARMNGVGATCEVELTGEVVDFGSLQPGETGSMTARLINWGALPCMALAITLDGDPEFSLAPETPALPLPLGKLFIEILYAPLFEGAHSATLSVLSDDPFHPDDMLVVQGTATRNCILSRSPGSLDFGLVSFGETHLLPFQISNSGQADCVVSGLVTPDDSPFDPSSDTPVLPFVVPPGESQEVLVAYLPSLETVQTGSLSIESNYSGPAPLVFLSGRGLAPGDSDSDGIANTNDNCLLVSNFDQRDTNGDGIGNACDADINNNCTVNYLDYFAFVSSFGSVVGDANYNEDVDNADIGSINFLDIVIFRDQFGGVPGPSANECIPAN